MLKELLKYVVIGIVAGTVSYAIFSQNPVSIEVNESNLNQTIVTENSYNSIYNSVKDSVVTIKTDKGRGSGVVVTNYGHVITNEHVIKGAKKIIIITADNQTYNAKIVGVDLITDMALLSSAYRGQSIAFSDSSRVKIGDIVLAIGNPFGVGQTLTQGIISRTNSGHITENPLDEFLQSDAAINPGNSGGAMVDVNGSLIGINTMNLSIGGGSDGIGLAVPSNLVKKITKQLIENGRVVRGYVGMSANNTSNGIMITKVLENGPAYESGLRPKDIIISIDKTKIKNIQEVVKIVASLEVNQEVNITFKRNNKLNSTKIKVSAMPIAHRTIQR